MNLSNMADNTTMNFKIPKNQSKQICNIILPHFALNLLKGQHYESCVNESVWQQLISCKTRQIYTLFYFHMINIIKV
jgi:hypothetical protein